MFSACGKPAPTLEVISEEPSIVEVVSSEEAPTAEPEPAPSESPASSNASATSKAAGASKTPASQAAQQPTTPSVTIPANVASDSMSKEEYTAALAVAEQIVAPLKGKPTADQLGTLAEILYDGWQPKNMPQTSSNKNNAYGYLVEKNSNCVGVVKGIGICLNLLGISWIHENKNKDSHQWNTVNAVSPLSGKMVEAVLDPALSRDIQGGILSNPKHLYSIIRNDDVNGSIYKACLRGEIEYEL